LKLEAAMPPPNESQQTMVYISYARDSPCDVEAAKRLYNDLKDAGLNPWLDSECILPGKDKQYESEKAIKNSRFFSFP
jgi:hypothetical protein